MQVDDLFLRQTDIYFTPDSFFIRNHTVKHFLFITIERRHIPWNKNLLVLLTVLL